MTFDSPNPEPPAPIGVLMLHGAAHNSSVWDALALGLQQAGWAAMAPDLPGHGRCPGPALTTVESYADWVLKWASHQGQHRLILVGHSMGALIALEAAARAAGNASITAPQVVGLILLGATCPMVVSPALLTLALEDAGQAIQKVAQYSHARTAVAAREADQTLMQVEQHQYAAAGHGNLLHHDLSLCNDYAVGLQSAARVACPSTLVVGLEDRMTPLASSAALQTALGAQRIELLTGHNLMAEDPAGVLTAVLNVCAPLKSEPLKP